ncbi:MAG: glycosyltransferase family 2 protein [Cyclonatronaceae bacterium]
MRGAKIGSFAEDRGQYDKVYDTELGHGAAMMIPMAVIKEVGLMPDIFFLYYEEHDWCEMIKRAGYKVRYVGTSVIYHKESMTVGRNSPIKAYYMVRGRLLFTRRNTKGIKFISSSLFFAFFALPKNALRHLLKGEFTLLKAYLLGVGWHLKGRPAKVNPQLNTTAEGRHTITGDTFQQIRRF